MRGSPLVLAVVASALSVGPTVLHAQEDTVLVEAVFRLDIEQGPSDVVPAIAVDSRLLLPLFRFLSFAEIGVSDSAHGRYVATVLEPFGTPVRFDTEAGRLVVGEDTTAMNGLDAAWRDGELFISTRMLDRAFRVRTGVDWIGLIAVVGNTHSLPVARRARRERARVLALRRQPRVAGAVPHPITRELADGAVLEFALSGETRDPLGNGSIRLGLGAELVGGSLEMSYDRFHFPDGAVTDVRASWIRAWPEQRWVRQVRVGDVQTGARRSRLVRGTVITNQPFVRSSEFDFEEMIGELPPGWEVELYDAYGLLDYGQADVVGEYRVGLPLRYGNNPFDMVLYGPQGEVVRRRRTIRVPFSRLPAGALEYAVGLGDCRADPCGGAFSADVRYGINRHVTAQAGWDLLSRDSTQSLLWQPYVVVSAGVLPALSLTGEGVANGLFRAEANYEPTPDLRIRAAQTFFSEEGGRFLGSPLDTRRTEADVTWFRRGPWSTAVQLSATRSSGGGAVRSFVRGIVTARKSGGRYAVDLRHTHVALPPAAASVLTILDLNGDMVLLRGPGWLRTATVGAGVGLGFQRGLESVRVRGGRPIKRTVRVEFGTGWVRGEGLFIDLGLSTSLAGPRFSSRGRFTTGAGTQGQQFVDGSVLWDRRQGRVRLSDGRDLGRAGVAGTVFLDFDSDGTLDDDEPILPGVAVRVAGRLTETDLDGRFSVWELFPFEPALIEVDTTRFESPFYVVENRVLEVIPTPNSFIPVDIPVVIGAEVSGGVLLNGQPLSGVRVELRETTTGKLTVLTTFADGGFYTIGLPPGTYEASVPAFTLETLGATSSPVNFTVPASGFEKFVDAVIVTLER